MYINMGRKTFKRIIIAIDRSDVSRHVMATASELLTSIDAYVIVLTVIEITSTPSEGELNRVQIEEEEKLILEHQKRLIDEYFSGSNLLIESKIVYGDPAEKICELAERINAHMIIIGSRGLNKLQSKLLGSVSEKVIDKAIKRLRCSVLIVNT